MTETAIGGFSGRAFVPALSAYAYLNIVQLVPAFYGVPLVKPASCSTGRRLVDGGYGAQGRSRMPKAPRSGGSRRRPSLTVPSTVALALSTGSGNQLQEDSFYRII